jgi:hypothetical protein
MTCRVAQNYDLRKIVKISIVVILAGAAARLGFLLMTAVAIDPDTASYVELARHLRTMNFAGWDGSRTPLFPLFLLLSRVDFTVVRIVQSVLGMTVALMLTIMVLQKTSSARLAAVAGVAYAIDLGQMSFESAVMAEALCTFVLMASVLQYARIYSKHSLSGRVESGDCAVLGALAGATALTRPLYALLVPVYLAALLALNGLRKEPWHEPIKRVAALATPAFALIVGWCVFNWCTVGYFGLMSTMGFGLSNQSGEFIELAPKEYRAISGPYLRAMKRQEAATGTHFEAIFEAAPEIYRETGWSDIQLSRELTKMSLQMFAAHPLLYARGVLRAWVRFWDPCAYFTPEQFRNGSSATLVKNLWYSQKLMLAMTNFAFILIAAWIGVRVLAGRQSLDLDCWITAIVLVASFVQAAMEFGENSRYSVPTVPLVFYVVVASSWRGWAALLTRRRKRAYLQELVPAATGKCDAHRAGRT